VNLQPIIEARLNDHATVGLAYSRQFVASHGANGSYQCCFSSQHTWSLAVSSGPLPVGFSISSSGLLQGTATAVQTGRYPLTLQTTDPSGQTAFQNFEFWVDPAPVVAINAGGTTAVGRFDQDHGFGGTEGGGKGLPGSTSAAVDTAGLFNPPLQSVFQTYRYDPTFSFVYLINNFAGDQFLSNRTDITYLVRLFFAESVVSQVGARQFNVFVNANQVLTNFDIFAETGRPNRAVVKEFTAKPGAFGFDVAFLVGAVGFPLVNAIEVVPATLFQSQPASSTDASDGRSYELGLRFTPTVKGQVRALRHWKSPSETGAHTGTLWDASGRKLAAVVFTGETASGWQEAALSAPVTLSAGANYVVSVNANSHFPITYDQFSATPVASGYLQASSTATAPNGLFGAIGTFPTNSFRNSNYFRDVVFVPTATPEESLLTASLGASDVPALPNVTDGVAYELGTRFRSAANGEIRAIRYYRAPSETGRSHTGHIWSSTGSRLASVDFTNETLSGWQEARLPTPLRMQVGQECVVSVNATYFGDTYAQLNPGIANGFLQSSGAPNNGLFGPAGTFPTKSFNSSNYLRDIVFAAFPPLQ
jgi:hypothetical protein